MVKQRIINDIREKIKVSYIDRRRCYIYEVGRPCSRMGEDRKPKLAWNYKHVGVKSRIFWRDDLKLV
jgi:hypothetical protein